MTNKSTTSPASTTTVSGTTTSSNNNVSSESNNNNNNNNDEDDIQTTDEHHETSKIIAVAPAPSLSSSGGGGGGGGGGDHAGQAEVKFEPAESPPSLVVSENVAQPEVSEESTSGGAASGEQEVLIKREQEVEEEDNQSDKQAPPPPPLLVVPSNSSPEYTMLKPVTPQAPGNQTNAIITTTNQPQHSSTILTDLDATSGGARDDATAAQYDNTILHDGSQQTTTSAGSQVKIELHEAAPAAVGATFSELTSVNPVTVHHQQQQQQSLPTPESHLVAQLQPPDMTQQQQQQHMLQHAGEQSMQLVYNVVGGQQVVTTYANGAVPPTQQQQHFDESISQMPSQSRFSLNQAGPPSVSSVTSGTSIGGMSTPTIGGGGGGSTTGGLATGPSTTTSSKRRSWSQMNRQANRTEIAKVYSQFGFHCYLEAPISTCRRKEEDRITYINKGEFYGLSLEYTPEPNKPLRSAIVKAVVMLVFREDKSPDDDLKSWQFWHSRQHSAKQRILDVDNKNLVNVINQIEEVSLNAIAFYWNPIETRQAKLNIAIQCLSTDFSNQKGVKGLPLNLQIDIYDLFTETSTPVYRAYATLLSYCDKGAQRRSRDEERRALKRKLADATTSSQSSVGSSGSPAQSSGGKKFEDLYHKPCDRTEFYAMADLIRAPTLYSPSEQEALGLAAAAASAAAATGAIAQDSTAPTTTTSAANTPLKQPMSQASLNSSSATTPIPSSVIAAATTTTSQQQPVETMAASLAYTQQQVAGVVGATTPTATIQRGGGGPFVSAGATGGQSYATGTVVTTPADYMTASPQLINSAIQPTGSMVMQSSQQQPQHLIHHQPTTPTASQQHMHHQHHQQHQHHHHHQQQQQHHQQQQQQQQQHYHSMQPSPYGTIGLTDPQQQQQQQTQQQYAILQPSVAMVQQQQPQHQLHSHHHHPHQQQQQSQQQQHQMQHQMATMDSSGRQYVVSSGGGHNAAMMQQQQQQQQQQLAMQHGAQYMAPTNNLAQLSSSTATTPSSASHQQQQQQQQQPFAKRAKMYPNERVLIYAKQADEKDFYPLHLSPPSLAGLVYAIEQKYKIDSTKVANIYKKSKKGIRVQMDDEMIRHYCNEDMVQLEVIQTTDSRLEITLVEL